MPPQRSITLTPAELKLMRVLWQRGESAVSDMVLQVKPLAYTSVLTTIRVLESKGYVATACTRKGTLMIDPKTGRHLTVELA